ncbi:gll4235 [Gloeobacter violaceus PCC 7421]|uniref:Gll4235 protein n=1 Tax=Gloeobacter violaceus (strain ATCC 29082 / PCC 7421) TaxID=251221 RepID=Q7NDK0_GLOVI|nr:gll4235 [Gloeobacter violaceus PCC 7421]
MPIKHAPSWLDTHLAKTWLKWSLGVCIPLAAAALIPATSALWSQPVAGQTTEEDVIVSGPDSRLFDPEFDQDENRFVWSGNDGKVWIGKIDPVTGNFDPPSGKFRLVAEDAARTLEVGNGPEWVYSSVGDQITYTALDANDVRFLAKAKWDGSKWVPSFLEDGKNGFGPIGSLDKGDPKPRISFPKVVNNGSALILKWRDLDNAETEERVPGEQVQGLRWVPGKRQLTVNAVVNGVRQAFLYDVDTKVFEQLTFDAGPKESVFMWQAPEFDNEYIFFALTNESSLGVYRKIDGVWTKIATVKPPSKGKFVQSPEPFVYNGKSYLIMASSNSPQSTTRTALTDIWLAGIDSAAPFYYQCSDPSEKTRKDPEVFITQSGPYLYYSAVPAPGESAVIYRCDTKLGPPLP